jgi:hypothetical protein
MSGRHLVEVFPALSLIALELAFFKPLGGPRYNPERRKTFQHEHWRAVLGMSRRKLGDWGARPQRNGFGVSTSIPCAKAIRTGLTP